VTGDAFSDNDNITTYQVDNTESASTGISVTIDPTGGNQAHQNYQPGIGVYYIIYIP